MVRVLESQRVALPEAEFESVHAIRVTLAFVRIAFQECTPDGMRGHGEMPEEKDLGIAFGESSDLFPYQT